MVFGVFFRSLEHRFKHEKEDSVWESKREMITVTSVTSFFWGLGTCSFLGGSFFISTFGDIFHFFSKFLETLIFSSFAIGEFIVTKTLPRLGVSKKQQTLAGGLVLSKENSESTRKTQVGQFESWLISTMM